ncbi:hypothetical protein ACFOY4_40975 [Actinomadura syzygii]|uniref:Glucose-6-phosphate dehydrogenase C-terminal domain-containing protein n=1 Tax=Actinomadura syzygii TaxID=1427538 RepID=A0A5D0TML3_9ACTN|nr:hypothetical protein FXF65_43045 [Actinomadura syzygii]
MSTSPGLFDGAPEPNLIRFRIQPDAGVTFDLLAKVPGRGSTRQVPLSVDFTKVLGPMEAAYQRILTDAITGDPRRFVRFDLAEESWRIIQPVLDLPTQPLPYQRNLGAGPGHHPRSRRLARNLHHLRLRRGILTTVAQVAKPRSSRFAPAPGSSRAEVLAPGVPSRCRSPTVVTPSGAASEPPDDLDHLEAKPQKGYLSMTIITLWRARVTAT